MQSNGFGSWHQKIVVLIKQPYVAQFEEELQEPPVRILDNGDAEFEYYHTSSRRGDDETIVFMFMMFHKIPVGSYEFLWDKCDYR